MDAFFEDISANNVPTPPTQTTGPQPAQTTGPNNEFEELLSRSTQKLYPGCDMTTLEFTTEISHIKALHKITDAGFNKILALLQKACSPSKGYNFPSSYYEIKKTYKKIGLGYESIHACINDCFLFWGSEDNLKMPNCPICKASRWKDPKKTKGKKVANKVVRYFPLTPRLQRMFNTKHIAKWMTWHATGQSKENGKMNHPCDGRAWKYFDMMKPEFSGDPRNVRLGLAADGFNPFGMMSQNYSMWPVILTTYNTPPWMCMKETSLMLTMLIPGPRSPAKDIDVYLQPLIKELQELWKGVWTKDAATGTHFQMKAAVLWTINDFPARSSLSGWSGQGYYACPTCNEDTPSLAVKNKIVYVGYRRFLRTQHPLRSKFKEFYGFPEPKPKPRKFTEMDIQLQISKVFKRFPGKHPDIAKKNPKPNRQIELNWSKRSIFWDLEYWPFLLLKNNLDVMHIEKNALEALLNTLLQNDKSKDTLKARQDLETLRVRKELWLVKKPNGKFEKPHPKYSFTAENRKRFCKFIKGVRLPDGFGSNFKQKVTADDNNITGMKSHDCHIMMHRLLPYGVQRYLPKNIAAPIIELCLFFKQLCARTLMQQDMAKAKKQSISIMIELEKIFPPAFFDIMIHVAIHLPDEAILAKPEGSIAEGYVAEEALTFCSRYLKDDVETRFNRPGRNDDGLPEQTDKFQVFRSVCKPTGRMKETRLTTDVMQAVVWFVLNNSPEVDADILAYREFVKKKVEERLVRRVILCGMWEPTSAILPDPAYIVNGVKFVVHERDILHTTQCSGVSTPGLDGEMYYGQLEEILKLTYIGHHKGIHHILTDREFHKNNQYILATQATQVFYLQDLARQPRGWKVVEHVYHRDVAPGEERRECLDDDEVIPQYNVVMACVALGFTRWGNPGGSPPRRPTAPSGQCSMLRLETGNASLRKAFRENNKQPLQLGFDYADLGTFHPLGNFASMLNSFLWGENRSGLFPLLASYFNLAEWYNNQDKVVVGSNVYTVGERSEKGHYEASLRRGGRGTQGKKTGGILKHRTKSAEIHSQQQEQEKELYRKQAEEAQGGIGLNLASLQAGRGGPTALTMAYKY
ncbi:hypothetical protein Tco_0657466 [Tanacetum coccineum]|uniref:DUF4218 domain-containing protein n=1 Tax=Tanacetum coccineum TaxID=301880 RepID=A0ABQ4XD08_9ASTR